MNLNTFFAIFDINNDNIVRGGEIMEFGKRRNMRGMANLAGTLLGNEGIQSYTTAQKFQLMANQDRFERAATTYFYSLFQRFDTNGDLKLSNTEYSRLLNTYAEDFLKRGTEEYRKVKNMVGQVRYKAQFQLRFCDFVKKYVDQFMLQGESITCSPFEDQLMQNGKYGTIESWTCSEQHQLNDGRFKFEAKCKVDKCKPGLVVHGTTAKCIATGDWTEGEFCDVPLCKALPINRQEGQLTYTCTGQDGVEMEHTGLQRPGTECKVDCAFGFRNKFKKGRTCGDDGIWRGNLQKCESWSNDELASQLSKYPTNQNNNRQIRPTRRTTTKRTTTTTTTTSTTTTTTTTTTSTTTSTTTTTTSTTMTMTSTTTTPTTTTTTSTTTT